MRVYHRAIGNASWTSGEDYLPAGSTLGYDQNWQFRYSGREWLMMGANGGTSGYYPTDSNGLNLLNAPSQPCKCSVIEPVRIAVCPPLGYGGCDGSGGSCNPPLMPLLPPNPPFIYPIPILLPPIPVPNDQKGRPSARCMGDKPIGIPPTHSGYKCYKNVCEKWWKRHNQIEHYESVVCSTVLSRRANDMERDLGWKRCQKKYP